MTPWRHGLGAGALCIGSLCFMGCQLTAPTGAQLSSSPVSSTLKSSEPHWQRGELIETGYDENPIFGHLLRLSLVRVGEFYELRGEFDGPPEAVPDGWRPSGYITRREPPNSLLGDQVWSCLMRQDGSLSTIYYGPMSGLGEYPDPLYLPSPTVTLKGRRVTWRIPANQIPFVPNNIGLFAYAPGIPNPHDTSAPGCFGSWYSDLGTPPGRNAYAELLKHGASAKPPWLIEYRHPDYGQDARLARVDATGEGADLVVRVRFDDLPNGFLSSHWASVQLMGDGGTCFIDARNGEHSATTYSPTGQIAEWDAAVLQRTNVLEFRCRKRIIDFDLYTVTIYVSESDGLAGAFWFGRLRMPVESGAS